MFKKNVLIIIFSIHFKKYLCSPPSNEVPVSETRMIGDTIIRSTNQISPSNTAV